MENILHKLDGFYVVALRNHTTSLCVTAYWVCSNRVPNVFAYNVSSIYAVATKGGNVLNGKGISQ